ncbi:hypothetical protein D8674_013515 [Pyrus ussuriensis x Pyrus communis]|uniref:Uncharacterized protein n=1 Tax=Pyrus ussuriensis x Pyrus communis TaxID=2448454 RepID=A0A5N5GPY4_9ROSA|nr:hypothetical protein D8674_013515 [Pyrus ussuriensis x Pyrus communis]
MSSILHNFLSFFWFHHPMAHFQIHFGSLNRGFSRIYGRVCRVSTRVLALPPLLAFVGLAWCSPLLTMLPLGVFFSRASLVFCLCLPVLALLLVG